MQPLVRPFGLAAERRVIEPSRLALVFFALSLASSGHRTSYAQPSFSQIQISRAAMSIWPRRAPCRAQVGSEWCRLCQDSPNDRIASQLTFRDLSLTSNSSLPNVWQIELIDQVTWCRNATRTRLPQKKAVSAPCQDHDHRPPINAGIASEMVASTRKFLEISRILRSASRSGQNFSCDVRLPSNIHPMC